MTEERKRILEESLALRNYFKVICGAGNEDPDAVRRISTIYTLAGANVLDVSARPEIVRAAMEGIDLAYHITNKEKPKIHYRPFITVSVGMPGDHHVRKANINSFDCISCLRCHHECPMVAIDIDMVFNDKISPYVNPKKCIGCGRCEAVCPVQNCIKFDHNKVELRKVLPACLDAGAEIIELHAAVSDCNITLQEWETILEINPDGYNSLCIDRLNMSNGKLIDKVNRILKLSDNKNVIIQADGYPMSGSSKDFNTTLQAVATADVLNKANINVPIVLSGGTNAVTVELAKLTNIKYSGIAMGSYARSIINEYIQDDEIFTNIIKLKKAISAGKEIIAERNIRPLIFAVDFDGTLAENKFPGIGEQTKEQKELLEILIELRKAGHVLILWTARGEPALTHAIMWCREHGLDFDAIQENTFVKKLSGPSPKIVADYYIDDRALEFSTTYHRKKTLSRLNKILRDSKKEA